MTVVVLGCLTGSLRAKDRFPEAYRIQVEMDPQRPDGRVPALERYDWQEDPDEMRNLAGSRDHPRIRERLLDALGAWARRTSDQSISPWNTHSKQLPEHERTL
jgi:hypothetical protein